MPNTRGWIVTAALAPGGTGHDTLAIIGAQIAQATITASNLAAGAGSAGYYGIATYGAAFYG